MIKLKNKWNEFNTIYKKKNNDPLYNLLNIKNQSNKNNLKHKHKLIEKLGILYNLYYVDSIKLKYKV